MKTSNRVLGLLAALVVSSAMAAQARDGSGSDIPLSEQVRELSARLSAYEAQLQAQEIQTVSHYTDCTDCSCDTIGCRIKDCWTRPCPGWYGDAELLLLKWTDTDGDDNQNDLNSGSRYTIGYESSKGRTLRVRYFEFACPDNAGTGNLQTEHLDLEYAGRFTLGHNWCGELSLGGRWATLSNPTPRDYADMLGPVVGLEVRSSLRRWLSLYGGARYSMLFGDELEEVHPSTFSITEIALGAEMSKKLGSTDLFFRTGVEAQQYTCVRDDEENYGLVGLALRFGIRR